jgi:hypothetical protein
MLYEVQHIQEVKFDHHHVFFHEIVKFSNIFTWDVYDMIEMKRNETYVHHIDREKRKENTS